MAPAREEITNLDARDLLRFEVQYARAHEPSAIPAESDGLAVELCTRYAVVEVYEFC